MFEKYNIEYVKGVGVDDEHTIYYARTLKIIPKKDGYIWKFSEITDINGKSNTDIDYEEIMLSPYGDISRDEFNKLANPKWFNFHQPKYPEIAEKFARAIKKYGITKLVNQLNALVKCETDKCSDDPNFSDPQGYINLSFIDANEEKNGWRIRNRYGGLNFFMETLSINKERDIKTLIQNLNDEERDIETLIQNLKHKNWEMRLDSAILLGELNDGRAVEPLINVLKVDIPTVRKYAAEALGKLGDPKAIKHLEQALEDEWDLEIKRSYESALKKICK